MEKPIDQLLTRIQRLERAIIAMDKEIEGKKRTHADRVYLAYMDWNYERMQKCSQ